MHHRFELLLYAVRQSSRNQGWPHDTGVHFECLDFLCHLNTADLLYHLRVVSLGQL